MRNIALLLSLAFILTLSSREASAQNKIKVACIGNSITAGSIHDPKGFEPYPVELQALLNKFKADAYEVKNFGVSGRTVLKEPMDSYWKLEENKDKYEEALKWQPDIVIIKFGTNDSKGFIWPKHKNDFYKDYMEFVNSFKSLSSRPKVFVCYSLPAFSKESNPNEYYASINGRVIREEIIPQVKKVALRTNSTFIDLYSAFTSQRILIKDDGIHPTQDGAEYLANEIYQRIIK